MHHTAQMSCALARQRDKAPAGSLIRFSKRIILESSVRARDSFGRRELRSAGVCNDYRAANFARGARRESFINTLCNATRPDTHLLICRLCKNNTLRVLTNEERVRETWKFRKTRRFGIVDLDLSRFEKKI